MWSIQDNTYFTVKKCGLFEPFVAIENEMFYISERTRRRAFNEITNSEVTLLVVYFNEYTFSHSFLIYNDLAVIMRTFSLYCIMP